MLVAAISTPASSEPTRKPALSPAVQTAFEAASWRGSFARVGSSAAWAGLCAVASDREDRAEREHERERRVGRHRGRHGASTSARPSVITRSTSRRELRSTTMPASGAASAAGTIRASAATPTAVAPPWS